MDCLVEMQIKHPRKITRGVLLRKTTLQTNHEIELTWFNGGVDSGFSMIFRPRSPRSLEHAPLLGGPFGYIRHVAMSCDTETACQIQNTFKHI